MFKEELVKLLQSQKASVEMTPQLKGTIALYIESEYQGEFETYSEACRHLETLANS